MAEQLEEQGYSDQVVEEKVAAFRKQLLSKEVRENRLVFHTGKGSGVSVGARASSDSEKTLAQCRSTSLSEARPNDNKDTSVHQNRRQAK